MKFKFQVVTRGWDTDEIPGGAGKGHSPDEFDPKEFEIGMEVEKEHTEDEEMRKEIVLDHLVEDPHYYSKLKKSGLELKIIPQKKAGAFAAHFKKVGQTLSQLEAKGFKLCEDQSDEIMKFAVQESGMYKIQFKYELAPNCPDNHQGQFTIPTSHEFCKNMEGQQDLYFSYEDIVSMPNPSGDSIDLFQYKGGYNCAHLWKKYVFSRVTDTRINKKLVGKEPYENDATKMNTPVQR